MTLVVTRLNRARSLWCKLPKCKWQVIVDWPQNAIGVSAIWILIAGVACTLVWHGKWYKTTYIINRGQLRYYWCKLWLTIIMTGDKRTAYVPDIWKRNSIQPSKIKLLKIINKKGQKQPYTNETFPTSDRRETENGNRVAQATNCIGRIIALSSWSKICIEERMMNIRAMELISPSLCNHD